MNERTKNTALNSMPVDERLTRYFALLRDMERYAKSNDMDLDTFLVFQWLRNQPKGVDAISIARTFSFDKAKVSRLMTKLRSKNLISEYIDDNDARRCVVSLSVVGRRVAPDAYAQFDRAVLVDTIERYCTYREAFRTFSTYVQVNCGQQNIRLTETHFRALIALLVLGHSSVQHMCEMTSLAQSKLSQALLRLETYHLVERGVFEDDKRVTNVSLSPLGKACLVHVQRHLYQN